MPTKVLKDGCRCIVTEFVVNEIDDSGDIVDINAFETRGEAAKHAAQLMAAADFTGVIIEKVVRKFPAHLFDEPTKHTTLYTGGDYSALKAGGWQ